MSGRKRIALIGAGNIGGSLAYLAAIKNLADVVLFDVVEGLPQGKVLDLLHALPLLGSDAAVKGTNSYEDISGADVCIVTAGIARKPGMSRDDLLRTNAGIIKSVAQGIKQYAPSSFVIVVSNPLDAMVQYFRAVSGFAPERVVGMAGVLDTARYRAFLAEAIGVSAGSIKALVLGGHGDLMVPVRSCTSVSGVPISKFLEAAEIEKIEERVRNAGGEVVSLLKTGSAFYSPATAALEMAESFLLDRKKLLPCAAFLQGEYGFRDIYVGVPVIIGAGGVERVVEVELNSEERAAFETSVKHVQELIQALPEP